MSSRVTACGKISVIVELAGFTSLLVTSPVAAQTNTIPTTGNLSVTAQVVAGCGILAGGDNSGLNFGTIDYGIFPAVAQGTVDGVAVNSTIQIECSPNLVLKLSIGAGSHASNGNVQRNLAGPNGKLIPYQLYSDAARTQALGVGNVVSTTVSGTVRVPIYGRVTLSGSGTLPGTYTDVAQVTLTY